MSSSTTITGIPSSGDFAGVNKHRPVLSGQKTSVRPMSLGAFFTTMSRPASIADPHQGHAESWCGEPTPPFGANPRLVPRIVFTASSACSFVFGVVFCPTQRPSRNGVWPHRSSPLLMESRRSASHAQISAAVRSNCCSVNSRSV